MANIEHSTIADPDIHECKGAASATAGQVPVATGSGGTTWTSLAGDISGTPGATTVTDLTIASEARGDLLTRGASAWQRLAPGTAGHVLQTNGAGADPTWVAPPSTTGITGTTSDDFEVNDDASGGVNSTASLTLSSGDTGAGGVYHAILKNVSGALALVQKLGAAMMNTHELAIGNVADTSIGGIAKLSWNAVSGGVMRTFYAAWTASTQTLTTSGGAINHGSTLQATGIGIGTAPGTAGTAKLSTVAPAALGEIGMSAAGRLRAYVGGAAVDCLVAGDVTGVPDGGTLLDLTAQTTPPATPASGHTRAGFRKYGVTNGALWTTDDAGATRWIPPAGITRHTWICAGVGTPQEIGFWNQSTGYTSGTASNGVATDIGAYRNYQQTANASDAKNSYGGSAILPVRPRIRLMFGLDNWNTNIRWFAGIGGAQGIGVAADNPSSWTIGIQFSSGRGDTYVQWEYGDGVTQTVTPSAVAIASLTASQGIALVLDYQSATYCRMAIVNLATGAELDSITLTSGFATSGTVFTVIAARNTAVQTINLRVGDQEMWLRSGAF